MSSQDLKASLKSMTDEEVETLSTYIDKCAEEGQEPTLEGLIMESEKFAEEVDSAYALGQQLAATSVTLAEQVSDRSDVPHSLVKSASGRYEDADFALNLADMALAALETVRKIEKE